MSIHAQVEGVGTLEFPDGTDPSVIQGTVKKVISQRQGKSAASAMSKASAPSEALDTIESLGSGMVASTVRGISQAGAYANQALGLDKLLGDEGKDPALAGAGAEAALTHQPTTELGKKVMGEVGTGLKAFEEWSQTQGDKSHDAILAAGDKAGEVAKKLGAPPSVVDFINTHKEAIAAAYGSATKTVINAVPLVLGGEAAKLPGEALRGAREILRPGEATPPAPAPAAAARPVEAPQGSADPGASAGLTAADVPRGTPSTIGAGPLPARAVPETPRTRAQSYVRDQLGLAWDDLADRTKQKLETIAAKAGNLEKLNPEAVKAQAHLEREGAGRVPITTTAGKLSRDNVELLREQGAAATPTGQSIVDTDVKANRDIRTNIETLVQRLGGIGKSRATATTREGVGAAVAGTDKGAPGALTVKQAKAKAKTRAAYENARKTDPTATVKPDAMYEFVRGNPEVLNPQIQHLSWLNGWLKKAGIETLGEDGKPTGEKREIKLTELDDLRKKAGKMAGGTGDSAHYAKEVLSAIDKVFAELPESAKAWKAARDAHSAERGEFKNQGAIARLVEKKGGNFGTDPRTALEDVWKAGFKNAKIEEVRELKRSLLSGDAETRAAGKKALRELRAATGRDFLQSITKGVSTNVKGETNITAEGINNWIKGMGDGTVEGGVEKLNVLIGRKATRELMDIRKDAQITKTEPTVRNVGSNTFQKLLNWMDDTGISEVTKHIPGGGLVELAGRKIQGGFSNMKAVNAAGETATSAAERAGAKAAAARLKAQQEAEARARRLAPTPQTYQGAGP